LNRFFRLCGTTYPAADAPVLPSNFVVAFQSQHDAAAGASICRFWLHRRWCGVSMAASCCNAWSRAALSSAVLPHLTPTRDGLRHPPPRIISAFCLSSFYFCKHASAIATMLTPLVRHEGALRYRSSNLETAAAIAGNTAMPDGAKGTLFFLPFLNYLFSVIMFCFHSPESLMYLPALLSHPPASITNVSLPA
jgi:hypothetical protein